MSSLPRYALSACVAAIAAVIAGCGPDDGSEEFRQGRDAYEKQHDLKKAERLLVKSVELSATNVDALVYLTRIKLDLGVCRGKALHDKREALKKKALNRDLHSPGFMV